MENKLYVVVILVQHLDLWLDPHGAENDKEVFIRKEENLNLEAIIFPAEGKEEAYIEALALVDGYDDIHFDGPGDKAVSKGIGIHDLYFIDFTENTFIKKVHKEGGVLFSLTSSYDMKEPKQFNPKIRAKSELQLFKYK